MEWKMERKFKGGNGIWPARFLPDFRAWAESWGWFFHLRE
jgi:hypothetical protein